MATVTVEVDSARRDPRDVMVDITNELARITTFPDDVEEPQTRLIMNRREVMILTLAGAIDEASLAQLARELEEELLLLPDVSQVDVDGLRRYELAALVREDDLQRYGLSFADVSRAVADANLDLPLGTMRTADEEALLRVQRLRKRGRELAAIPVVSRPDGARVRLGQVAQIRDGFVEDERRVELDGKRAAKLTVWRTGDQDTIRLARTIRKFVEQRRASLPAGVELVVWRDFSEAVVDRLGLLTRNGSQGLLLVFAILLIFLGTRLSFWVAAGLPVAFLAAMVFLDAFGGTLNMISSFALIMILGILVDDSIVVAENIARRMREDGYSVASAVAGLQEVTWPVIASVTTTAVAFMPLFFIEGIMGKFIRIMPVAVIACLLASLVEALLILPAHLAHGHAPAARRTGLARLRERIDGWTEGFIANRYGPSVDWALRNRYVVLTAGFGFLIVVLGVAASGRPAFTFFPAWTPSSSRAGSRSRRGRRSPGPSPGSSGWPRRPPSCARSSRRPWTGAR